MCADGVNFGDYLVRNERWLIDDNETAETKSVDGKLSDNEISIFFSNTHINTDGDDEISSSEFDNWYSANSSAISAYLDDIGADYNDASVKAAMLESMTSFMQSSQNSDIELMHLNEDTDSIVLGEMSMPTADQISSPTKTEGDDTTPATNQYSEAAQSYYDSMKNLSEIKSSLNPNSYQDKVESIISDIVNDKNIDSSEKLALLEDISTMEKDVLKDYFAENDVFYINALEEIVSNENYTIEDVMNLTKRYNALQGDDTTITIPQNSILKNELFENLISVTEKAASSGQLENLIKSGFTETSKLATMIQQNYKWSDETNYLKRIMNAIGSNKSIDPADYQLNDEQVDLLKKDYLEYQFVSLEKVVDEKDSMFNIIKASKEGTLDKKVAQFLLQDLFGGDMSSLIDTFRSLSSGNEEKYLEELIDIYMT